MARQALPCIGSVIGGIYGGPSPSFLPAIPNVADEIFMAICGDAMENMTDEQKGKLYQSFIEWCETPNEEDKQDGEETP